MPKIRRKRVPGALLQHLWDRVEQRELSHELRTECLGITPDETLHFMLNQIG